ncbi:hypothetical protein [Actinomadura rugatobispora]|uniref:Glycine zipper domain-containing protein n=1 Tax=Actinomadura rugatobispora TaxID=1994 RepID=A0ABW1AF25_9ACTN|nr:hypothetical protein GCM10010200_033030 [Actinomadura rugatobispora]
MRDPRLRGREWLIGLILGSCAGAAWGALGNDYEPADSAIGTGLLGAVAGVAIGLVITTVRQFRSGGGDSDEQGGDKPIE